MARRKQPETGKGLRAGWGLLALLWCSPGLAQAADYPVRNFTDIKSMMYRTGPNLSALLTTDNSFFMGVHFRQTGRSAEASEPSPLLTIADSGVGPHRYMRLEIGEPASSPSYAVEIESKSDGLAGGPDSINHNVGEAVTLDQWYAAGLLVAAKATGWEVTLYSQPHGGSLQTSNVTASVLNYADEGQRLDLYSVARHRFVVGGTETDAHQFYGDIASPVWVLNPRPEQITQFMARQDPANIWTATDFLGRPNLETLTDLADGNAWSIQDADKAPLNGTLSLGDDAPMKLAAPGTPKILAQ